jgi:hypothetical protein
MLLRMDVAWFDIRKHPSGNGRRAILTKPFDGPYIAALILGLSPEKNAGLRPTSNGPNRRSFEGSTSK